MKTLHAGTLIRSHSNHTGGLMTRVRTEAERGIRPLSSVRTAVPRNPPRRAADLASARRSSPHHGVARTVCPFHEHLFDDPWQ
jgi:hypothetical protein